MVRASSARAEPGCLAHGIRPRSLPHPGPVSCGGAPTRKAADCRNRWPPRATRLGSSSSTVMCPITDTCLPLASSGSALVMTWKSVWSQADRRISESVLPSLPATPASAPTPSQRPEGGNPGAGPGRRSNPLPSIARSPGTLPPTGDQRGASPAASPRGRCPCETGCSGRQARKRIAPGAGRHPQSHAALGPRHCQSSPASPGAGPPDQPRCVALVCARCTRQGRRGQRGPSREAFRASAR